MPPKTKTKMSKDSHDHQGCGCSSFKFCTRILQKEFGGSIFKDLKKEAIKTLPDDLKCGLASVPTIYTNGTFRTMKGGVTSHVAEAMAVDARGTIKAIGSLSECQDAMKVAKTYDLKGGFVYPGFIDPHIHLLSAALESVFIDIAPIDQTTQYLCPDYNMKSCFAKIKKGMDDLVVKDYVLVMGMDPSLFVDENGNLMVDEWAAPTASDWQKAEIPDNVAVVIMNASMHVAYLNDKAIKEFCPLHRGNGTLLESDALNAAGKVVTEIYKADEKSFVVHMLEGIRRKLGQASAAGITTWWDAVLSSSGNATELEVLSVIGENGPMRYGGGLGYFSEDDLGKWEGITPDTYSTEKFRIKCAKIVSDGSNQGLSGYQMQKYPKPDPVVNAGHECGVWNIEVPEFQKMVQRLDEAGWACMIHANGDEAINRTLEAFSLAKDAKEAKNETLGDRHRIEHCSFFPSPPQDSVTEAAIDKMAALGVHPSFLIGHVGYWGASFEQKVFPHEDTPHGKAERLDLFRSSLDRGLRCTVHSDHTVTPLGPLRMMEQAVGRKMERGTRDGKSDYGPLNPKECITMAEAIKAVTYEAAWQCHYDDIAGSLEVGKKADFVVFDQDLMQANIEGFRQIPVRETWMNGIKRHDGRNGK